jgi:hypothetical protein
MLALLGAAFGPGGADAAIVGEPVQRTAMLALGAASVAMTLALSARVIARSRTARFGALGALLCTFPLAASFPSDRLLPAINLGAMPVLAATILACGRSLRGGGFERAGAVALLAIHAVIAPLSLPLQAGRMQLLSSVHDHAFAALDSVGELSAKTLVVLGGPTDFWIGYLQAEREWKRKPRPHNVVWVAHTGSFSVRSSPNGALSLSTPAGFFADPAAALYRSAAWPFSPGEEFRSPRVTFQIAEVNAEGSPSRLELAFDSPRESSDYAILAWNGSAYELVSLADFQAGRVIETPSLFTIVLSRLS